MKLISCISCRKYGVLLQADGRCISCYTLNMPPTTHKPEKLHHNVVDPITGKTRLDVRSTRNFDDTSNT